MDTEGEGEREEELSSLEKHDSKCKEKVSRNTKVVESEIFNGEWL